MQIIVNDKILVFFDTNIFRNTGFDFNSEFYKRLESLKTKFPNLSMLIVPILYHEIVKQLKEVVTPLIDSVNKVKKDLDKKKFGSYSGKLDLSQFNEEDFLKSRIGDLNTFLLKFTDESSFDLSNQNFQYNTREVLQDFFKGKAPFIGSKKYEFKDAFLIQNLYHFLLNPEYKDYEVVIVSEDAGFKEGVKLKIDREYRLLNDYKDFFNFLSTKHEKYNSYYSFVSKLDFSYLIKEKINKYIDDNIENYILENDNIFVDGSDLDRKGLNHGYDYDEVCITRFELVNLSPKINITNIDDRKANVSLKYKFEISFTGIIDNGEFENTISVDEKHTSFIYLNIELEKSADIIKIIKTDIGRIELNKHTLKNRSEPIPVYYNYYVNDTFGVRASERKFTVTCDKCKNNSEFYSPTSEDFESGSIGEGSMGDWIQHTCHFYESCNKCGNEFNGEIVIIEYPYLIINDIEIKCEGGQIGSLDFYLH